MINMKNFFRSGAIAIALVGSTLAHGQQVELPRPSPNARMTQTVGITDITIDYSSPAVHGRKIWGALVPFDKLWRAGANLATKITFSRDVVIDGKPVPAGAYAFFVIPTQSKWTLILNKNANQPGMGSYKKEEDLLRVDVKPQAIAMRERLAYLVSDFSDKSGNIDLEWEKLRVSLPFTLHTDEQVAANVKGLQAGGWNPWVQSARWSLEKKRYDEAMQLVDTALKLKETWLGDFVKAEVLAARGLYKEAFPLAQRAKELGDQDPNFFYKAEVEAALKTWKSKS
jgi:hypothetical protein